MQPNEFEMAQGEVIDDPYDDFDRWLRGNGFADVAAGPPEAVDLKRLAAAIKAYGRESDGLAAMFD